MKIRWIIGGALLSLASGWALAERGPESLLPPGFDEPAPAPAPAAAPAATPRPGNAASTPAAAPTASGAPIAGEAAAPLAKDTLARLPTLAELEAMSPEELEQALGLKPTSDMPPGARRSTEQVGILDVTEGGLAPQSLGNGSASLVRKALAGNRGRMVSRWGHILLRRALASRLNAPAGMNPADFAALRAGLLLRMGEPDAARALVQDVDAGNFTPRLVDAAFDTYVATADLTGLCPVMVTNASARKDPQWEAASAICSAFRGDSNAAMARLDRALYSGKLARIDGLLAQRYAGAAGKTRRTVKIEWDGVDELTPWRYGLALAVGLRPPEALFRKSGDSLAGVTALAPMLGLVDRAAAADVAAGRGVLSSKAMVDLYSEIYADDTITGDWSDRAESLHDAYVAGTVAERLTAMQALWNGAGDAANDRYSRLVLTSYAAARMPVNDDLADDAADLVASMLAAGLDANAMRWAPLAPNGSQTWGMLVLAAPQSRQQVEEASLKSFIDDDESNESRKSAFLLAGLAGLGRVSDATRRNVAERLEIDIDRQSRWTTIIDAAARQDDAALVAILAGLGMQGSDWNRMSPRFLYHIVSALRQVGLEAEARMIAAEAVARA